MSVGGQRYGVQVGNEIYSVVVTDDDWEKRRIERERQRRLSQETNRRRKALEERKKIAEEREARKRTLQLTKRRQRQTEATEKYQRAHLGIKHEKKLKGHVGHQKNTLDNVMHQLRSGNLNMTGPITPTDNNRNVSAQLTNQGRMKFETKLQEEQQRLLEQHKLFIEKEFKEELERNAAISEHYQRHRVRVDNNAKEDLDMHDYLPVYTGQTYSDVDLMSGQVRDYPAREYSPANTGHTPNRDFAQFADSLSRLFIRQPDDNEVNDKTKANNSHQLRLEEADDAVAISIKQPNVTVPMESSVSRNSGKYHTPVKKPVYGNGYSAYDQAFDDQDSLHGSISSGNSPVYSNMMTFQKMHSYNGNATNNYFGKNLQLELDKDPNEANLSKKDASKIKQSSPVSQFASEYKSKDRPSYREQYSNVSSHNDTNALGQSMSQSDKTSRYNENNTNATQEQITKQQNIPLSPNIVGGMSASNNYYLKSYRPWSATVNSQQQEPKAVKHRPVSAAVTGMTKSFKALESDRISINSEQANQHGAPYDHSNRWLGGMKKTNATPISAHYAEAWASTPKSTPQSTAFGARSPVIAAETAVSATMAEPLASSANDAIPSFTSQLKPKVEFAPETKQSPKVEFSAQAKQSPKAEFSTQSKSSPQIAAEDTPISGEAAKSSVKSKGILRKHSKYDRFASKPYHSAAASARQHWVDHIIGGIKKNDSAKKATLNGVEVRDSLEGKEDEAAQQKSVRWHEIHYNDGTSATLTESGAVKTQPVVQIQENQPAVSVKRAPKATSKTLKQKAGGGKGKGKPAQDKPAKKGAKGNKGRKLKVVKDAEVPMEPHPPLTTPKKQLAVSNSLNYSIASTSPNNNNNNEGKPQQPHLARPKPNRVAWVDESEGVTMDTLKSSGIPETKTLLPSTNSGSKKILSNPQPGSANQITIHVVRPEVHETPKQEVDKDSSFNLSKTPTDQEINWLWDKVRTCLSQRSNTRMGSSPITKSSSDTSRFSGASTNQTHRQAWGSPISAQQKASIISIDGALFMRDSISQNSNGQSRNRRLTRPSSAVTLSARHSRVGEYGTYLRRQALAQQRRHKQLVNYRNKADIMKSISKYPPPKQSHYEPLSSPSTPSSAPPFLRTPCSEYDQVDDSTTAFLLAETLAEQNMSEEQILRAMEALQNRTRNAQSLGKQVVPSALSVEENQLLKSLERLNTRLREVQSAMASNPNIDFFHSKAAMHEFRPPTAKLPINRVLSEEGHQRPFRRY